MVWITTHVIYGMIMFKLALQAAGYIASPTQGVALGWYKLAFQAAYVPFTFIKGFEDFDTLFEGCTVLDRNRDMYSVSLASLLNLYLAIKQRLEAAPKTPFSVIRVNVANIIHWINNEIH